MIAIVAGAPKVAEVTDARALAAMNTRRQRFRKNADWLQRHVPEVYARHRGKHICVAGQELFVADSAPEAIALARSAHPDDDGFLLRYIPREKMERVYAHSGAVDVVR
jgi:hypothetical protein